MEEAEAALQSQLPAALRQLQQEHQHQQQQHQQHQQQVQQQHAAQQQVVHHDNGSLTVPLTADLDALDPGNDAFSPTLPVDLGHAGNAHHPSLHAAAAVFEAAPQPPYHDGSATSQSSALQAGNGAGPLDVMMPVPQLSDALHGAGRHALNQMPTDADLFHHVENAGSHRGHGPLENMRLVVDPPNLQEWRQRLFDVNETITMTEDEFLTYFPHVDNVYSHRSTQRYKRKPFVSHYWDCRLKGRPSGTPKSEDPNKKKRRRIARQRDLCDVKIKITEYFPGAMDEFSVAHGPPPPPPPPPQLDPSHAAAFFAASQPPDQQHHHNQLQAASHTFGVVLPNGGFPPGHPAFSGRRFYTIQRVNGNGGNGKGDGVAGPHKHTLEDSDRIKKNSVMRHLLKDEKERKKTQKHYHKRATGLALATVKKRSKESDLKLYGSCFCPFVQRVWIALEAKGLPYQYIELDPYKKPDALLEVNPRGLVPALRHGDWGCYESTVILEYLEDLNVGNRLLPIGDARLRADCRIWIDHINRKIVPLFYMCLQAQELSKQLEFAEELKTEISRLVDAAHVPGPYFLGAQLSLVDVQFAPWMLRLSRVLKPYRGWPDPEPGSRWGLWMDAIERDEVVKATTSTDDLYLDSYERYAENRPDTSQLATAIISGRGLP